MASGSRPKQDGLPMQSADCFSCLKKGEHRDACLGCSCLAFILAGILTAILLPLSLNSVEYNEFGLERTRSTGKMKLDKGIFGPGRYVLGPDNTFKKFRADAHLVERSELSVFSADKLEVELDIHVVYFLNESMLIELHNTFERNYRPVVEGIMVEAIKNRAPFFKTSEYFTNRTTIEEELFKVVRENVKDVFVDATALYLARVTIPGDVRERQLQTATQLEANEKEQNLQASQLIRTETIRLVNEIDNNATLVTAEAEANAEILVAEARGEAARLLSEAFADVLLFAYDQLNVTTDQEKAAYDYIRALEANAGVKLFVSEEGNLNFEIQE